MDEHEKEARYEAMLDFIGCFPTISGPQPTSFVELGDGVMLFEALSHISPDHFDPSTIARSLGDNWALKSSNLRKLVRNLETYFHEDLNKTANFEDMSASISSIARTADKDAIANIVELIAAAAVTCDNRADYVGWIMNMSEESQAQMKGVIESSMAKLSDYDLDDGSNEEVDSELVFDSEDEDDFSAHESSPVSNMNGLFKGSTDDLSRDMDGTIASEYTSGSRAGGSDILRERNELRSALQDARRELASHKSQTALLAEEHDSAQRKLRALAEDLQERLQLRQDELTDVESELSQLKRLQEDSTVVSTELREKNAMLSDELDVANAKAEQLRKAEATVIAYRKKLEGVGVMNQQMTDLEDQSAAYLRQIMDLESETKKVPELQKNVEELRRQLAKVQKETSESADSLSVKNAEIAKLKDDFKAAERSKKLYEDELNELKSQTDLVDNSLDGMGSYLTSAHSLSSAKSVSENKEKMLRLEIENKKLKEQLENSHNMANAVSGEASLKDEIAKLIAELKKKEAEKEKLGRDKEKLEAYTKKTLSKFQEKYLVALQECKSKLKEKHDKIEALEMRSAAEKTAQKREERLLSSSVYELGLAIMQQRLKER
jgi:protein HOOK3